MILLALVLMLKAAAAAPALPPDAKAKIQPEKDERPGKCTPHNARPATVEAIVADPFGYAGHCVTVAALSDGQSLFATGSMADEDDGRQLGLDNFGLRKRIPRKGLHRVTAVGRVHDCREVRAMAYAMAPAGSIVMVGGFCHVWDWPYLFLYDVRVGPRVE